MKGHFVTYTVVFTFVWVKEAHAYLDPGMGTMLIQSIVALLAAVLFAVKVYWQKIKTFFSRKNKMSSD